MLSKISQYIYQQQSNTYINKKTTYFINISKSIFLWRAINCAIYNERGKTFNSF